MDLFMGAQRQRIERVEQQNEQVAQRVPSGEAYSLQQESYREELAFDKKRARRRKSGTILRAIGYCVGVPVVLAIVFVVSYVLTCIINGATPDEVVEMMGSLVERVRGFVWQLMGT